MGITKNIEQSRNERFGRKQGQFVQQGVGKKLAVLSTGQLRAMFPTDTAMMNDAQVLAARGRLLKNRFG